MDNRAYNFMQRKKIFKRILWSIILLGITTIVTAFSLAYIYEDKIKSFTIEQINESINAQINVESIELSFFSQFPKASLDFTNVSFFNNEKTGDSSLAIIISEKIFLSFDVIEMMNNNYQLDDIVLKNSTINLDIYKNGDNNFSFLSEGSNPNDSSNFLLNLKAVRFINTEFNYNNFATKQSSKILINDASAHGVFTTDNFEIDLKGNTTLHNFYNQSRLIIANKVIDLDLITKFDIKQDKYTLKEGNLVYEGIPFKVNGDIQLKSQGIGINASLSAKMLKASDITNNLSTEFQDKIKDYSINALVSIDVNISGNVGGKQTPHINAYASIDNLKLKYPYKDITLSDISLRAKYNNGKSNNLKSSSIIIENLSGKSNLGSFTGNIKLLNFWDPKIKAELEGKWDLTKAFEIIDIDTISSISGDIATHSWLDLSLNYSNDSNRWEVSRINTDNNFNIQNGNLELKDSKIRYSSINCKGRIENNNLIIYNIAANANKSKISGLGSINNIEIADFHNSQKPLSIQLNMVADNLTYSQIMDALPSSSETDDSRFSNSLDIVIDIKANEFIYNNIISKNVSGRFQMRNRRLSFFNIKAESLGGKIDGMLWIDGSKTGKYDLYTKGNSKNININKAFSTFNNFSQEVVKSENISGSLDSKFEVKCSFNSNWDINTKTIVLNSEMKIRDGILRNIEALNALKSYTKIDDFSELKFSELSNNISIQNSMLIIPQMEVNSNKMNIKLSGQHGFNNSYDYHFSILLSEIMGKKYEQSLSNEFGEIENDGLGRTQLFISLKGKGDDFEVKYDRNQLGKKIKSDLQEEKNSLKNALNEEFGWFKSEDKNTKTDSIKSHDKKSSSAKAMEDKRKENLKKQEEGEFIIDWDDE